MISLPCIGIWRSLFHLSLFTGTTKVVSEFTYSVASNSPRSPERMRLLSGKLLAMIAAAFAYPPALRIVSCSHEVFTQKRFERGQPEFSGTGFFGIKADALRRSLPNLKPVGKELAVLLRVFHRGSIKLESFVSTLLRIANFLSPLNFSAQRPLHG